MKEKDEIYPFEADYQKEVRNRLDKGGVLWLVERIDTNEFLVQKKMRTSMRHHDSRPKTENIWTTQIPTDEMEMIMGYTTEYFYLSKEDAEKYAPKEMTEGGCRHCFHGSTPIPTIITEHEFVTFKNPE